MSTVIAPQPTAPGSMSAQARGGSFAVVLLKRAGASVATIVLAFVLLIVVWEAALSYLKVSKFVGKTPRDVWNYLFNDHPARGVRPMTKTAEVARSEMWDGLSTTLLHAGMGFVFGLLVALLIASLFVLFKPFEFAFLPIALMLRSVPLVAMAPVLLLILGHGTSAILAITAIVVLFPALVNLVLGLRSASQQSLDVIRVYGGSERMALRRVRIPASLPNFFAAVRISVPGAMVGAMLGEWLSGFKGLGGLLSNYKGSANYTGVWTIVAVSVMASIVLYAIATIVEAAVLQRWGPNAGKV